MIRSAFSNKGSKAFFAPGITNWTREEIESQYGTLDELVISLGTYRDTVYRNDRIQQSRYVSIILVNPPKDSGTLELSATLTRDPKQPTAQTTQANQTEERPGLKSPQATIDAKMPRVRRSFT